MCKRLVIGGFVLASLSACGHPELSPSYRDAVQGKEGPRSGWHYVCRFEDQAWFCPDAVGRVFPERREAEAALAAHLVRYPDHRGAARVKGVHVKLPEGSGKR